MNTKNNSLSEKAQDSAENWPLKWSARRRHSAIEINGGVISRTTDGKSRLYYSGKGILTECIPPNNGIHKWSVKIKRLTGLIAIGICQVGQAE
jgi:hypothetical protein